MDMSRPRGTGGLRRALRRCGEEIPVRAIPTIPKMVRLYTMKAYMRSRPTIATCCLATIGLLAQTPPKPVYVQDGNVNETLDSIFIPPMPDAPFTCMLDTEWVRTMADGGTLTTVNRRRIARQANGRLYQERWTLVPKHGSRQSQLSHIQIADPVNHTLYTCAMGINVCRLTAYGGNTTTVYQPVNQPTGLLPGGQGSVLNEPLGKHVMEHADVVGTRITRQINAWVAGNDRAFAVVREFWFAPALGINVSSRISDPRSGSQSFTVTDLTRGEPDDQLFELPKGYTVRDDRLPIR